MSRQIFGQDTLLREIDKIFEIFMASTCTIRPHFFLTGPSGSGKTETMNYLAAKHKTAFLKINGAQLTKEGTSGNSLSKALSPLLSIGGKPCIVFVDEFDKLFISGNSNDSHAHETTTGVQNEFLAVLENDVTSVFGDYGKYVNASVNNVLFVFAGAFNGEKDIDLDRLRELGIKTEFLGRVGLVYSTSMLTLDDLYNILDTSPLLDQYLKVFARQSKETVVTIIKNHIKIIYELNTLGARIVNTLIHQYFIKGGRLDKKVVKEMTFNKQLEL